MTATDRAKELLAEATASEPKCTCFGPNIGHDESCCPWFKWMFSQPNAEQNLREKTSAILVVAIKAIEVLEEAGCPRLVMAPCCIVRAGRDSWCDRCTTLAAWERLFPARKGGEVDG